MVIPSCFTSLGYGKFSELLLAFSLGGLTAELTLLSTWLAFGIGSWVKKAIIVSLTTACLIACFLAGLRFLDGRLPIGLLVFVLAAGIGSLFLFQIPFLIFRKFAASKIAKDDGPIEHAVNADAQFDIKGLLVLTAVVAILVAVGKWVSSDGRPLSDEPWLEIVAFALVFFFYTVGISIPSVSIVFDMRNRHTQLGWLFAIVVFVGPALMYSVIRLLSSGRVSLSDALPSVWGYALGHLLVVFSVLLLVKTFGYRFVRLV